MVRPIDGDVHIFITGINVDGLEVWSAKGDVAALVALVLGRVNIAEFNREPGCRRVH